MTQKKAVVLGLVIACVQGACGDSTAGVGGGGTGVGGGGGSAGAPGCGEPTGDGTEHQGVIAADETWTAAGSPHIVTFDTYVDGATLTVEPCAVVRIRKGYSISVDGSVGAPGAIVAHGESIDNQGLEPTIRPVIFQRDVESDPWGSIVVSGNGMADLGWVTLIGGGDPDTAPTPGGTIVATGDGGTVGLTRNVRVVHVTIDGSGTFGASLTSRAGFTEDSSDLVVRDAGSLPPGSNIDTSFPLYVDGPAVSTIPEGTFTGNATDEIFVANAASLADPEITFHKRGVPYRFSSHFSMAPLQSAAEGGLSTLTLEAGVVMRFDKDSGNVWGMGLGSSNGTGPADVWPVQLIADGTADAPIVLTSAEASPAAGDWAGIHWAGGPAAGSVMSHVRVAYAGGASGTTGFGCGPINNDAALTLTNWRPDDLFIADSIFSDSAGGGIVSGWYSDASGPELVGTNTFEGIANGCNVSRWKNADSSCPSAPPICF